MALDHYATLGRSSGLRISPLGGLGGDDLRPRPRLGLLGRGIAADHGPLHRGRWQLHRHGELLHGGRSEKIIGDHIGHDPQKRDRLVIATKFSGNL